MTLGIISYIHFALGQFLCLSAMPPQQGQGQGLGPGQQLGWPTPFFALQMIPQLVIHYCMHSQRFG